MDRQFNYYCLPEDLAEIHRLVFVPAGGRLFCAEKVKSAHSLIPVDNFALDRERMGKETLFLFLMPPESLSRLVYQGPWIDDFNSYLIEVGRCYTDGTSIRSNRFWYESRIYSAGEFGKKSDDFSAWTHGIFKQTKSLLRRQTIIHSGRAYTEWFGKYASNEVTSGKLKALVN